MSKSRKTKFAVGLITILIINFILVITPAARIPKPPDFGCDCFIKIAVTPELNEPFEVVFVWTPRSDFGNLRNIPDTASLTCSMNNVQYISGDTLWTGYLENGKNYELKGVYKITKPNLVRFEGLIVAQQAKGVGSVRERHPELCLRAIKDCHLSITRIGKNTNPAEINHNSNPSGGDSLVIQQVIIKEIPGLSTATAKESNIEPQIHSIENNRRTEADTILLNIPMAEITENYPIFISSSKIYKLTFPQGVSDVIIDSAFTTDINKTSDNMLIIDKLKTECAINLRYGDSLYQLPIRIVQ